MNMMTGHVLLHDTERRSGKERPILRDDFGIGQQAVARIRMAHAMKRMGEAYLDAFQLGYVPPKWRQMRRQQFAEARAEYEQAKEVLNGTPAAE